MDLPESIASEDSHNIIPNRYEIPAIIVEGRAASGRVEAEARLFSRAHANTATATAQVTAQGQQTKRGPRDLTMGSLLPQDPKCV
jgi:hypothetical protein